MNRIFIFGTGSSINDIKNHQWSKLQRERTLGISWFFKKEIETDYYYSHEFDSQPIEACESLLRNNYKTKVYLGVDHFIGKNRGVIAGPQKAYSEFQNRLTIKRCKFHDWLQTWNGKIWNSNDKLPPCSFDEIWAKTLDQPLCGFRGTLMASINLCTILGYDEIILCGVDLNNGLHFYKSELSPFEKDLLNNYNPDVQNHSTQIEYRGSHGILSGLKWISKYIKLKVATKLSLLYDEGFEYFDLENEI